MSFYVAGISNKRLIIKRYKAGLRQEGFVIGRGISMGSSVYGWVQEPDVIESLGF